MKCPKCGVNQFRKPKHHSGMCSGCVLKENTKLVHNGTQSTSTIGAIGEMEASSYFLRSGYGVYRSVSPNSTHDLIIQMGEDKFTSVEVRIGRRNPRSGKIWYSKNRFKSDIVCVVTFDGITIFDRGYSDVTDIYKARNKIC